MTKQINVTETDCKRGLQLDAGNCPVGRAIARRLKKGYRPSVGVSYIEIWGKKLVSQQETPLLIRTFVSRFDEDRTTARPFSFELSLPLRVLR